MNLCYQMVPLAEVTIRCKPKQLKEQKDVLFMLVPRQQLETFLGLVKIYMPSI